MTKMIRSMALAVLIVPAAALAAGQAGDSQPAAHASPMVLETVFAAADRTLWVPPGEPGSGKWFSTDAYHDLGSQTCEGVALRSDYNKKRGTWDSGLELAVKKLTDGMAVVKVRAAVDNPNDNHDMKVGIRFEVLDGDTVVATDEDSTGVEEGDEKKVGVTLTVPERLLKADPMPKLRLTMTVERD